MELQDTTGHFNSHAPLVVGQAVESAYSTSSVRHAVMKKASQSRDFINGLRDFDFHLLLHKSN